MSGIYGIISNLDTTLEQKPSDLFFSSRFPGVLNEDYQYQNFAYGRSVINQFVDDRIIYENDKYIVVFEGVMYKKESLDTASYIIEQFEINQINFVNKIKGQFCGFIYDKQNALIKVFSDQLSTKPIYYYLHDGLFIFSSELKVVSNLLDDLNIAKTIDYDAVHCMLTYGYMLNDITYEKSTKKLPPFSILTVNKNFEKKMLKYNEFDFDNKKQINSFEAIIGIDVLIRNSVNNCWKKDIEYGYEHYCQLSGGLDSRVNLFLAKDLGFNNVTTFTFSQSRSDDDNIAQEICNKEGYKHIFYSLDGGNFLEREIEKYVLANDGLNNCIGSASGFDFMQSINHQRFGALHSGQIGDLLFGSYVKNNFKIESGLATNRADLLEKISFIDDFRKRYNNKSELFGYEQRVPNGTLNGDRSTSHFSDLLSPFYDVDLINYCLSIPNKLKANEGIYLDWFNSHCAAVSKYKWESAGVKPKNIKLVLLSKFIKRYKNGIMRRLGFNINDMNPFDIWLRHNKKIPSNLSSIFEENIDLIEDEELKSIVHDMYTSDIGFNHYGRNNKFIVITLLLSIKLHFPNGGGFKQNS